MTKALPVFFSDVAYPSMYDWVAEAKLWALSLTTLIVPIQRGNSLASVIKTTLSGPFCSKMGVEFGSTGTTSSQVGIKTLRANVCCGVVVVASGAIHRLLAPSVRRLSPPYSGAT